MWEPLRRVDTDPNYAPNPQMVAIQKQTGVPSDDEIWLNDRYQVRVRYIGATKHTTGERVEGRAAMMHLSINSHDRGPVRNWRHLQQIKNEVAGEDRVAVEIFPPEDFLTDTSNQYHLWVMPEGESLGFGFAERFVSNDEDVERFNNEPHRGHQEPWEPGLTTGRREGDRSMYEKTDLKAKYAGGGDDE